MTSQAYKKKNPRKIRKTAFVSLYSDINIHRAHLTLRNLLAETFRRHFITFEKFKGTRGVANACLNQI